MKKFQRFAIVSLIRLYPLSWRNRYKEEFLALLEDYPLSWRVLFDVFWGAIQAHLNKTGKEWRPVREISKRLVFLALVGLVATYVTWLFASGIEQIF